MRRLGRAQPPLADRRRLLGQRRAELRGQLLAQAALEIKIGSEPQPPYQAQDGGRADADRARKLGRALQTSYRIFGKQLVCNASFRGRKAIQALSQAFDYGLDHRHPMDQLDNLNRLLEI